MKLAGWQAAEADILAIVEARHPDPFAILGPHVVRGSGLAVRCFAPGAERVVLLDRDGTALGPLACRHPDGFFEILVQGRGPHDAYRLRAENAGGSWEFRDPYAFGPVLGQMDDHLLVEGTHRSLYERLGAHPIAHEGAEGVHFALWAPNASRVSVVGDFNRWDGRRHQMRKRVDSGLWEIFAPDVGEGTNYKYEIADRKGRLQPLKADPFGFGSELRPSTASVVTRTDNFTWEDEAHRAVHAGTDPRRQPMAIYEVHLGSWQRREDGWFLSYDELADRLIPYALDMEFTHLELLPVCEHPLDASWGYQPIGLFAPTRRFGDPAGFARLVDRAHRAGLRLLIDWVPAHFPTDQYGLARFDGEPLYEYADPRRGYQPDWNTAIYDFGRREVANVLIANALYWLDRFHVDGLRVDAVSSMLYLDYSRKPGEWLPNEEGGNTNKDAVRFLQRVNELVYAMHPGVLMTAEESTAWAGVSRPAYAGGLGFGFKWNMGWMHDTLDYISREPVHRRWHHNQMTFGMMYAYAENFVLPVSHDEVVHGKRSLLGRIPGDEWQRFATARAYYGFMWGHPGKKLLFMGQEFGQAGEWDFARALPWHELERPLNRGLRDSVRELNRLYRRIPALHARDCEGDGFRWIVPNDMTQSVYAWVRFGAPGDRPVAVVSNFTPVPRHGYRIGLPQAGRWREIFNSDSVAYGGSGQGNLGQVTARPSASHGFPASAEITAPPLATVMFQFDGE